MDLFACRPFREPKLKRVMIDGIMAPPMKRHNR